ncbi:MAG: serine hydrolase domain-containing protein [Alphaproteobacteria bacterium]|nr:serine hydrolase domain-containing protein [Alphaproteobacteria bacterium]
MQKNVLVPLGMHASTFNQPLSTKDSQIAAHGHIKAGEKVKGNWHIYPEMAAAGLWTNPTDLAHFILSIQNILKGHAGLLHIDLVKEMIKPQIEKTGLGVFVSGENADFKFSHGGVDEGFIAELSAYPFRGQGMIVMVNSTNAFGLITEVTHAIADVYKIPGFEPITKKVIQVDPMSHKKFVGVYKHDKNEVEIVLIDEKLFVLNKDNHKLNQELWPIKVNTFFDKNVVITLEFKGSSKKIDAFEVIHQNGKKTII